MKKIVILILGLVIQGMLIAKTNPNNLINNKPAFDSLETIFRRIQN